MTFFKNLFDSIRAFCTGEVRTISVALLPFETTTNDDRLIWLPVPKRRK